MADPALTEKVHNALPAQRTAFNVPDDVAYFNTANLSPQLHVVRAAGVAALERRGRPWDITSADWFTDVEEARALFARLVGATPDDVAMVPATSYGFAVAARNLPLAPGDRVLVLAEEYPSGIYTWRAAARQAGAELLTVRRAPEQCWTQAILDALDERVAIVSVPNVHWTDGALIDLHAVAARARDCAARLVIDGSQSVGALPLDVTKLQPDFVITVGYKWLLGPFGVGYMYVAQEHQNGEPLEHNWIVRSGSEDFNNLVNYRDDYQPGARRFDVGQRTKLELMPMATAALSQLTNWQVGRVAASLQAITNRIANDVAELGLDPVPAAQRSAHLLGVQLPPQQRSRVIDAMAQRRCFAAVRGGTLRVAPHLHTTDDDVRTLLDVLATIVADE